MTAQTMIDNDLLTALAAYPTSLIGDCLERIFAARGIRAHHRTGPVMVGRALTVQTRAGDNMFIHKALELVQPGDVIVVDGEGYPDRALIGEIMSSIAAFRGAAGFVIDGAIRDTTEIGQSDFPVFARAASHRGPYKNGPGQIGVPVSIGGMIVHPGDVVMGDGDGIISFPFADAARVIATAKGRLADELAILTSIRDGSYTVKK